MAIIALVIIEFIMFAAGVWALLNDALPERGFDAIFGKGDYRTSVTTARLFGILLALPFLAFLAKPVFTIGLRYNWYLGELHIGVLFLDLMIAILWARYIKKENVARAKMKRQRDFSAFVDDIDDWH
jgi:hypothetical protein